MGSQFPFQLEESINCTSESCIEKIVNGELPTTRERGIQSNTLFHKFNDTSTYDK
jgi:hypothetical protein